MLDAPWELRDGGMPVEITGYDASTKGHSWKLKQVEVDGTTSDDPRSGFTGTKNLFEMNQQVIPTGSKVMARYAGLDAAGKMIFVVNWGSAGLRPCTLAQTGGANGTGAAACSWTYTLTDQMDNTITYSNVAPEHNRLKTKTVKATRGTYWVEGSTVHLILTDEIPDFAACNTSS